MKRHKARFLSEAEMHQLHPSNLINLSGSEICTICGALRVATFFRGNQGARWERAGCPDAHLCDGIMTSDIKVRRLLNGYNSS